MQHQRMHKSKQKQLQKERAVLAHIPSNAVYVVCITKPSRNNRL